MKFISNGDYIFPFHFPQYWAEHVYTWSYQSGAANPDGFIRLPGRLIDILVFAAFGNIAIGYFYAASCLVIAFLAFMWFAANFLDVRSWGVRVLGGMFFALNPIFLGNLSKVGLVLAVAMLPVALTALKQGFEQKRFSYFLLTVLALNVSLLHPFTFALNALVCAVYLVHLIRKHSVFVRDNLHKFAVLAGTALLLNAYIILPLLALGTVDKSALNDTVSRTPVDYTSLVDIANTGDIFTALSLSKGVLKDYEFYGAMTWPFYFLGVFGFYALLLGVYVRIERRAKPFDRRRFVMCLGVFLLLLVLSTASYLHADTIIKTLINLPGGWMFRSPLKWQLYMPLVLIAALMVALKYVQQKGSRRLLYIGFGFAFVLMNGYLFTQIYQRLLVPRTVTHFSALARMDLTDKNLLFVNSSPCMTLARENPEVMTELNQIFISKEVQVKRIDSGSLDTVNLAGYDFVFGCSGTMDEYMLSRQYRFARAESFASDTYQLYRNTQPRPFALATAEVFATEPQHLGGKFALADTILNRPFNIISNEQTQHPATGLQGIFEDLTPSSIQSGALNDRLRPFSPGRRTLFILPGKPLNMSVQGSQVIAEPAQSGEPTGQHTVTIPEGSELTFAYRDPAFTYENEFPNPSLEAGTWQQKVGDCNNHDNQAVLSMQLDTQQKTHGNQSLLLQAKRHIACTGPNAIPVTEGSRYLLNFDYQTSGNHAGYFAGFNDTARTSISERLTGKNGGWQSFTTEITVPPGANHLRFLAYAYPPTETGGTGVARYDNFSLIEIPNVVDRFFLVNDAETKDDDVPAPVATSKKQNPTKHTIQVANVREPFYLATKETFDARWQLRLDNGKHGLGSLFASSHTVSAHDHLRMNGSTNGWYIQPQSLCANGRAGCTANTDGSYTINFVMEYTPQRWFYIGCIITLITAAGAILYVIFDIRRARGLKKGGHA